MHYFSIHSTDVQNKELYKTLCKKLHPDMPNGNSEAFIEMKKQYEYVKLQKQRISQQPINVVSPTKSKMNKDVEDVFESLINIAKNKLKKSGQKNVDTLFSILGEHIIGKKR